MLLDCKVYLLSLHGQVSKKARGDAPTRPHSPTTITAPNTLDKSTDVLQLRTHSAERRQTSVAVTEPTDVDAMALLTSSTNTLLAQLVRPGADIIPAATIRNKSPCGLSLEIGSSPGCLQVLEMERAQVGTNNEVDSDHASTGQRPSNLENLFDETGSTFDDGSAASDHGDLHLETRSRNTIPNLAISESAGSSRRTNAPANQTRARENERDINENVDTVPSKSFFNDEGASGRGRRRQALRQKPNSSTTRGSVTPKKKAGRRRGRR